MPAGINPCSLSRSQARCWWQSRWTLRWTVLMGGQIIPKFNVLMNDYSLPMGTDGLAIIGTFGLWLALAVVLVGTAFKEIPACLSYPAVNG